MVAAFPWYDLPSVQWANDMLWNATGYGGALCRDRPTIDLWQDPELFVSQACGLDLFLSCTHLEPVAAPIFDLDCKPGCYYSYIVGDLGGRVAAVNSLTSHSGYTALLSRCSPQQILVSGSHTASLAAIKNGAAEVAAIDAVTWSILGRDNPERLEGIPVVGRSADAPAPPYVAQSATNSQEVSAALRKASSLASSIDARQALFLKEIVPVIRDDYAQIWLEYQRLVDSGSDSP